MQYSENQCPSGPEWSLTTVAHSGFTDEKDRIFVHELLKGIQALHYSQAKATITQKRELLP